MFLKHLAPLPYFGYSLGLNGGTIGLGIFIRVERPSPKNSMALTMIKKKINFLAQDIGKNL